MKKNIIKPLIVAILLIVPLIGCGGGGSSGSQTSENEGVFESGVTLYGTVIDLQTRTAVSGAAVTVSVDDEAPLSTTTDAEGFFSLEGPLGDFRVQVSATGYATMELFKSGVSDEGAFITLLSGTDKVELEKACSTTVVVVSDGSVVSNATVYATASNYPEVMGTTAEDGSVLLEGLSQTANYTFVVPASDTDGDGNYNFQSSSVSKQCINSEGTVSLELTEAERDDSISITSDSGEAYALSAFGLGVTSTGNLVLTFNYPISLTDTSGIFLGYNNNLVSASDANYGKTTSIAATSALSAGNTVLTIDPASDLQENQRYTLQGIVSAVVNDAVSTFDFTSTSAKTWYVPSSVDLSTSVISADNYNGKSDGSGSAGTVYLEFPGYVSGEAVIVSQTVNGTATSFNNSSTVNLGSGSMVVEDLGNSSTSDDGCTSGACGSGSIVKYRVSLSGGLSTSNDNTSSGVNNVVVFIDAVDYRGNEVQQSVTLNVE